MVYMLAYNKERTELDELVSAAKEMIAYYSADLWEMEQVSTMKSLQAYFSKQPMLDLACYDVSEKQGIEFLRYIRSNGYQNALLMLLADCRMSPMEYIKPEILASELLLKPYSPEQLKSKLRELFLAFAAKVSANEPETVFVVETKDGKTRIPFAQIYYFEAREKKLFARTRRAEYPFYRTLDDLEQELPENFIRCHRSYVVNWNYVERIDLSASVLLLANEVSVPFSRTYKAKLKALK